MSSAQIEPSNPLPYIPMLAEATATPGLYTPSRYTHASLKFSGPSSNGPYQ